MTKITMQDIITDGNEWEADDNGNWIARRISIGDITYFLLIFRGQEGLASSISIETPESNGKKSVWGSGDGHYHIAPMVEELYSVVIRHYNDGAAIPELPSLSWARIANAVGKEETE